jgi:hypothetical protein
MLQDARLGKFSHIATENAERFGRDDAEALRAIDELHMLGIAVRFADYPSLNPVDANDRIMISLSFTLARRESKMIGERAKGGIHTKLRNGGHTGKAPDGYINKQEATQGVERTVIGRTRAWVEHDPKQWHVWRCAWDLLLEDEYTLEEICIELQQRGYTLRDSRPFVKSAEKGRRTHATNVLSAAFHNWFYAGWVVSEAAGILPKTIPGMWKPVVTTEEFEKGLVILERRSKERSPKRKHFYLLRKILYLQQDKKLLRLSGCIANVNRKTGGNPYYSLPGSKVNISCAIVDSQIPKWLEEICVHSDHLELLRTEYHADIDRHHVSPMDELKRLNTALDHIKQEEIRISRIYSSGKISEDVWAGLWTEWQERRVAIRQKIALLGQTKELATANLDEALVIFNQLPKLYGKLPLDEQRSLLGLLAEKVIVDSKGTILRIELHPPFAYLAYRYDALKTVE